MTGPMSFKQFMRYWRREVGTRLSTAAEQPGTYNFDLSEIEAALVVELSTDPMARLFAIPQIAKDIVQQADRARRPSASDIAKGDLFGLEHKWIPLGRGVRVRMHRASPIDLTVWLGIVTAKRKDHNDAADAQTKLIQEQIALMLKHRVDSVGEAWTLEFGWTPTEDKGDDDDPGDEGGE